MANETLELLVKIRNAREMVLSAFSDEKTRVNKKLRVLTAAENSIFKQASDPTADLFKADEVLSPELKELLKNPTGQ